MDHNEMNAAGVDAGADHTRIDVTIPASAPHLPLLRRIAAALAVSLDFDIDTVADLRLAVDELGAGLVTRARPGAVLDCTFAADDATVTVSAGTEVTEPEPVDPDSFGWMVLTTLADEAASEIDGRRHGFPVLRASLRFSSAGAAQ